MGDFRGFIDLSKNYEIFIISRVWRSSVRAKGAEEDR